MRPGEWEFRPGLWPSLAALLLVPVLIGLGFWQLDRADQKQRLEQAYRERRAAPAVDLADLPAPARQQMVMWRRALLRGEYLPGEQYLLDNQVIDGRPGYLVYTPFRLAGGEAVVLVNRGWVPMGKRRSDPPSVPPPVAAPVQGTIKMPQSAGLTLDGAAMEELGRGLIRLQSLDLEAVAGRRGEPLLPYVVRLDGSGNGNLVRDWAAPGFGRERHLGYAFQWFAMATAVVVLYLVLNLKHRQRHE